MPEIRLHCEGTEACGATQSVHPEGQFYATGVKRVLVTGMSGTGKSSVVRELVARGYKAVDTDDGWCEPQPDGRQAWRHAQFDHIVLLSAPIEVLMDRVATRTTNSYGKSPEELRRFIDDVETVEPLLRRVATHEVQTTAPLEKVVTTILRVVDA